MSKYDKKYDAFQLFEQILEQAESNSSYLPEKIIPSEQSEETADDKHLPDMDIHDSIDEDIYYEIEYGSVPIPGVGKFVKKSKNAESAGNDKQQKFVSQREPFVTEAQKIEPEVRDEIREQFNQMRNIARDFRMYHSSVYSNSKFYNPKVQQENSIIFYKQGTFMKDFEDEYGKQVSYSSYFPYYQMMGYEQLRTYFTWRTQVRRGIVKNISLSYAYLYIYELLNNIGVDHPQDGLEKLMFFWKEFRTFDNSIDKYVIKWIKDYHIYYELAQPFSEFIKEYSLAGYYQELSNPKDNFSLLCTISKYDIRKSVFFTEDRAELIKDCIIWTVNRVRQCFAKNHLNFDDFLYQPAKNMTPWVPFKGALFYPWLSQHDRRIVLSEKEVYVCQANKWFCQTSLTNESGRKLLGYVIKQTEAVLRQAVKYKYKLTANINSVGSVTTTRLLSAGIHLEDVITRAVMDFYRETTKTVVKVDAVSLEKIRREALITQEKLTVPETETAVLPRMPEFTIPDVQFTPSDDSHEDSWTALRNALSETELAALSYLLNGGCDIKGFADQHGIMLEVLMDGINEKAMDIMGDNLVDKEFIIYEDYLEQVKGMVE